MKERIKFLAWRIFQAYLSITIVWLLVTQVGDYKIPIDLWGVYLIPIIALAIAIPLHIYHHRKSNKI